jgi:hypothetical protein
MIIMLEKDLSIVQCKILCERGIGIFISYHVYVLFSSSHCSSSIEEHYVLMIVLLGEIL